MTANNHIYTIYKATNIITGKGYIGFDSNWPKRRSKHYQIAFHNFDFTVKFHNAIRKYGKDSFCWDILYQSKNHDYTLKIMEEHFIREYHTHISENGYNMTWGGDGQSKGYCPSLEWRQKMKLIMTGRIFSEEHKHKISIANKGKKLSIERRQEISEQNRRRPPVSKETRKKISLANKGKPKPPFSKKHKENLSKAAKLRYQKIRHSYIPEIE